MNKTVSNILNHLYFSPSLVQWVIFDILTRKYWSTCHTLTILIKNTHFIMSKCWIISKHSRKTHFWNIILKYPPHLTSGIMVYTLIKRNFDVERVFYRWDHLNVNFIKNEIILTSKTPFFIIELNYSNDKIIFFIYVL